VTTTKKPAVETDETGLPEDPAEFDLMDWLNTGTIARRRVTIYNDPSLVDEFERIEARLAELGWSDDETPGQAKADAPLVDPAAEEIEDLLAERDSVIARWDAAKSVWTVRAVSQTEVERSFDEVPIPKAPTPP